MTSTTIISRVSEFLKKHPPFYTLTDEELESLAEKIQVRYYDKGDKVFVEGDKPSDYFYTVRKGSIALYKEYEDRRQLTDKCDEGDIFGVRALLAGDNYIFTAEATEESLVYAIPNKLFKTLLEINPKLSLYFAAGFAAGLPVRANTLIDAHKAHKDLNQKAVTNYVPVEMYALPVFGSGRVVSCSPETTIMEAAQLMNRERVGSVIIVNAMTEPLGIITDSDLRRKVVAVDAPVKYQPVSSIMSSPVITVKGGRSVAELTLLMMNKNIRHLCITADGTANSSAVGVVSTGDLLSMQGNNPATLVKQIFTSTDPDKLRELRNKGELLVRLYLEQEISVDFIAAMITEINDALIKQAVLLAEQALEQEGYTKPASQYCWIALGSEGRKEQLLRTDQDNAIIYEDPPLAQVSATADYYLQLGTKVKNLLVHCGFAACPANVMASNPELCLPVKEWKHKFFRWIAEPDPEALLQVNIFFDFRPVAGNESLAVDLRQYIAQEIKASRGFINFFAKNALQNPPPLSFFRNFIVEKSGGHKNEFDIKARAMMPFSDAARVLAYDLDIRQFGGTIERFREIAKLEPSLAQVCSESVMAYEILMRLRATEGLRSKSSGRYIDPKSLNKIERQTLRNIFYVIEELQAILTSRYQLNYIR